MPRPSAGGAADEHRDTTPPARPLRLTVYCDATELGGAETSLHHLLAALQPGIEVTILAAHHGIAAYLSEARPRATLHVIPPVRNKRDIGRMITLRRAIAETKPDIFQANLHSLHSCQYALAAAETLRGVSVVAVEHSLVEPDTRLALVLKRWTSRRLAAHVAVGHAAAREVERVAGLPARSVRAIHNGVPDERYEPADRAHAAPTAVTIARLDPIKGIDVALDALSALPGAHLVVIGDGPARADIEGRMERLGLTDRVQLMGHVPDARALLSGFDLFVLPSRSECFPLTVIEAMLAELPVVATAVGSVSEAVVDGVTGLLVPPCDPTALAGAIGALLADAHRRVAMGRAGRRHAREHFDVASMARSYEALYDEITEANA